jgi:hypothetical protein
VDDEVSALLGSLFGKDATKEGFMAAVKAHPMFPHLNQKKVQHALDQFGVINNGLIRMRIGNMLRAAIQNVPLTAEKAADKAERAAKAEAAKLAKAEAKAKAREERKAALAAEKAEADALAAKETENAAS